ncbi:MAG: ABC transporter permease, partial [Muribaculaceae bacterium]|nr:ABC transporter permease [Muribaculaceae bacterium]
MSVLAGLVIFGTAMNYVLLSLASLRRRAKTVGVQKCNGASGLSIAVDFAAETILLMLASLVVVAAGFYAAEHWFADTLGYSVTHYVSTSRLWVLG